MNPLKWQRKPKPGPEDYDGRIQAFFESLGESTLKRLLTRKEPLQDLFDLVRRLQSDQRQLEREFALQTTAFASQSDELSQCRSAHNHLLQVKSDLEWQLEEEREKLRNSEKQIRQLRREHEDDITSLEQKSKSEQDRLVSQLLINQSDTEEWEDDKLKRRFLELHKFVNGVCSHSHSELHFPAHSHIGPDLDPYNFFSRNHRERGHFLIKRIVWSILQTQFFSQPFGFGALGPGKSEQELFKLFGDWEELCRPSGSSRTYITILI